MTLDRKVIRPERTVATFPIAKFGHGNVECAATIYDGKVSIFLGRNGTGVVGGVRDEARRIGDGETLAMLTFANKESLDVLRQTVEEADELFDPDKRASLAAELEAIPND